MMIRGTIVVFLAVIAALLIFEFSGNNAGARAQDDLGQVLQNQKLILEKLNVIENKLDVLKIRATRN